MAGITPPSPKLRPRRETVQGAAGQAGHDVRVADGENKISGKLRVETGNPEQHGRRNLRARRETVQGAAGQAGHDVRVADGEDQVGVSIRRAVAEFFDWVDEVIVCVTNKTFLSKEAI